MKILAGTASVPLAEEISGRIGMVGEMQLFSPRVRCEHSCVRCRASGAEEMACG